MSGFEDCPSEARPCGTCPEPVKTDRERFAEMSDERLDGDSTLRQTTEMDPEVAALHSVVGRLETLDTDACRRVLEFCVQRFLDTTLHDDGR